MPQCRAEITLHPILQMRIGRSMFQPWRRSRGLDDRCGEPAGDRRLFNKSPFFVLLLALVPLLVPLGSVSAADAPSFNIVIKDHRFEPSELRVPAGKRVELVVDNQDATPEEFESHDLKREKIIPPKSKVSIWVGPLSAGEYGFFGEFNEATAQGKLIAE